MKYFFSAAIAATGYGEAHSAEAVRFRIKQMIDEEMPADVLSDDAHRHEAARPAGSTSPGAPWRNTASPCESPPRWSGGGRKSRCRSASAERFCSKPLAHRRCDPPVSLTSPTSQFLLLSDGRLLGHG